MRGVEGQEFISRVGSKFSAFTHTYGEYTRHSHQLASDIAEFWRNKVARNGRDPACGGWQDTAGA